MQRNKTIVLVLVTAPDLKTARKVAQAALEARLAACVNLIPRLESHYWWEGKIESSAEVLLVLKTTNQCLARLEAVVLDHHPYETAEFVVLSMQGGNRRYLEWVRASVTQRP